MQDARSFLLDFFHWYNTMHHHGGLGLLTPFDVHHGLAETRLAEREATLRQAFPATPERFVRGVPTPPPLPRAVGINKPRTLDQPDSAPVDLEPGERVARLEERELKQRYRDQSTGYDHRPTRTRLGASSKWREAQRAESRGDQALAERTYEEVLNLDDPNSELGDIRASGGLGLALLRLKRNRPQEAMEAFCRHACIQNPPWIVLTQWDSEIYGC